MKRAGGGGARGEGEGGKASHSSLPLKTMETSLVMSLLLTFSSNGWAHVTEVNNKDSLKIVQYLFLLLKYSELSDACMLAVGAQQIRPCWKIDLRFYLNLSILAV